MIPKNKYLAGVLLAGLSCVSLFGQEKSSSDRLVAPHWQFSAVSMMQPGEPVHVLASSIHLLPTTEAAFHIGFAKEKTVQVPPRVVLEVRNTGVIEYRLHNCQVSLLEWPKRR
jgi:hypothetical protein